MNIVATATAAERLPRRVFTVDDVSRMMDVGIIGEDEKFELVEGEIVIKAAKPAIHDLIKSDMSIAAVRALPGHLTLGVEITLRLTDILMLEPDIAVFPKELLRRATTGFARLEPGEAHLVIEVAVTSLAYDRGLKARLYARGARTLGDRRRRAHDLGAHRTERQGMVVNCQARATARAHDPRTPRALRSPRRDWMRA
jgi:Uma2 family endonuclease